MPEDKNSVQEPQFGRRVKKTKQISVRWYNRRHEYRTEAAFGFFCLIDKGRNSNVPLACTQSLCTAATTASKDETQEKKF